MKEFLPGDFIKSKATGDVYFVVNYFGEIIYVNMFTGFVIDKKIEEDVEKVSVCWSVGG
jgi:hypothetical protein